jgi:hypothetical protein
MHVGAGTGKTTSVVEYIRQEVRRGRRVLATAPSNVAVDNMLERLAAGGGVGGAARLRMVRLGHPARLKPDVLRYSLDAAVAAAEGSAIVADVRKELAGVAALLRSGGPGTSKNAPRAPPGSENLSRKELRREERRLRGEIRRREEAVVADVIKGAQVVLATCTGAATKVLSRSLGLGLPTSKQSSISASAGSGEPSTVGGGGAFDVVVIDEVGQALEAACWIPLLLGAGKAVLAGDHLQLPPTIISDAAAAAGLGVTLADRVVHFYPEDDSLGAASRPVVHMLTEQYRMHACISSWASAALYRNKLHPAPSVAHHRILELEGIRVPTNSDGTQSDTVMVSKEALLSLHTAAAVAAKQAYTAALEASCSVPAKEAKSALDVLPALKQHSDSLDAALRQKQHWEQGVAVDIDSLNAPMLLIDTAGCEAWESQGSNAGDNITKSLPESKSNVTEAHIVVVHVLALLSLGVQETDIAVITPYNAQVGEHESPRQHTYIIFPGQPHKINVERFLSQTRSTIGGWLPRPREGGLPIIQFAGLYTSPLYLQAIVLSLVRSNVKHEVGFLADFRRLNVAITRARRHVTIVR